MRLEVIAYPRNRRLWRAVAMFDAQSAGRKGECLLTIDDVLGLHADLVLVGCAAAPIGTDIRCGAISRRDAPCLCAFGALWR